MKISAKARRNISRVIPFGLIWLITGCVFILVEIAAMGTYTSDSETVISLSWTVFAFAMISVTIVGLMVGMVELIFIADLFKNKSFSAKIFYKLAVYTLMMLLIISITYPIAASLEMGVSLFDPSVWERFTKFLVSITFLSTLLQMGASLSLSVIYAGISENLGHNVLVNFLTGRYHRPRQEERIFMFLDMRSSTTLAEKLGHIRYFDLLQAYYTDLSNAIINNLGEVYQYIGDEVVITWKSSEGLLNNRCIECFFAMKSDLKKRSAYYEEQFGIVPSFKAGIHIGNVTVGEIGALKKEIFFTGDVLNVTSRIQGLCNDLNSEILVSADLAQKLDPDNFELITRGKSALKGRIAEMELFAIQRTSR